MKELSAQEVRRTFDVHWPDGRTTEQIKPLAGIIGQERAVAALQFGLAIRDQGFHIYVAGPPGIGKRTAVRSFLEELARGQPAPPDWCYLYNFEDPYQPKACRLPAGRGRRLQQDMKNLIEHVRRDLPKVFEREEYSAKRDDIVKGLNRERDAIFQQLTQQAGKSGFALEMTPMGVAMVPLLGGHPLKEAEFRALPASVREDFDRRRQALEDEMQSAMKQARELERATQQKLQALDEQVALYVVGVLMTELREQYAGLGEVLSHLDAVQKNILENIELFKGAQEAPSGPEDNPLMTPWMRELPFRKYVVNVLVDNSRQTGTPVVVATNPTYNNLFGRVEKESQFGSLYTDFTMIQAGDLHRANGGYLVVRIEDLLKNAFSWDALKRALQSREIDIEDVGERLGFLSAKSLRPQPLPLDVKVILIGPPLLYYLLHSLDDEFPELFRTKADFDTQMDANAENIEKFLAFAATVCGKESLKPLDATAASRLLAHAARLAGDQRKLSTHFGALADVIREADYWARRDNAPVISEAHVRKALDQKIYRSNLIEQHIREMVERGTLLIDTDGAVTGQVNGLSVLSLGDYWFGRPSRITASVAPGRDGIVDIEREVELGGPVHSKGVLILSGYLAQKFAREQPLTLAARLVFEQSYEGVEGDSASGAELFALLSALADAPIKQSIAVTGSVNQHGVVQAIGGVNEKVEGFFDVCRLKGLTGQQGVIIPQSNAENLLLRDDVVEAIRAGQFHIWPIASIDEGIEVLTGMPAGMSRPDGKFEPGSINERVATRLTRYAEYLKARPELESVAPVLAGAGAKRGRDGPG